MNDMTKGPLARNLILFCIPLLLGSLLQQLFGWADAFILGNSVGETALAAIGASGALTNFFLNAVIGFTSGVTILSANYFGRGDLSVQRSIFHTFLVTLVGAAIMLCTGIAVFAEPFLRLLDVPGDIFDQTLEYARIIILGVPFLAIYNTQAAVLRGVGDSRAPLYAVAISVVTNIGLDLLLMNVFGLGIVGAAIATVTAQVLMAVFLVLYAGRAHEALAWDPWKDRFDATLLKEGASLALPLTVQNVIVSAGNLLLTRFMNGFGSATVAGITTSYTIDGLIMLPLQSLATGIATAVSQNEGAREYERSDSCIALGLATSVVFSTIPALLVRFFGGDLVALFGVSAEVTAIGAGFFRAIAFFYIVNGIAGALRGYVEGRGWALFSGVTGVLTLLVRISLSYALVGTYGNMVIAYAEAFSWVFLACVLAVGVVLLRNSRGKLDA